jgi:tRNA(fMet)-specific endonuclease VapC
MRWLVDTNIISLALRKQHGTEDRLRDLPMDELALSAIVQAEGWTGAWKSPHPERWLALWHALVGGWTVLPFDAQCADRYARLRADLERAGRMIGIHDCQIAATALVHGLVLVTANQAEFARVPGLPVENWAEG